MIKKKRIVFFSLFAFSLFSGCNMRRNSLKIEVKDMIANDIEVRMEVLGSCPMTEIYKHERESSIPNGYGENEWYFIYQDSMQGYMRHVKINRNDKHDYSFLFHAEDEKILVDVTITGASPIKQQIELKKR